MITEINKYKLFLEEVENILEISGILIVNKKIASQEDIYSKIRSLTGVTILSTQDIIEPEQQDNAKFRNLVKIKIDKYPFNNNNNNDGFNYQEFISKIKNIKGVINFIIK